MGENLTDPTASAALPSTIVDTEAGRVTLVELPTLQARATAAKEAADELGREAQSLRDLAQGIWVQRGQILIDKATQWRVPPSLQESVRQAGPLVQRVKADEATIQTLREQPRSGIGGLVGRATGWNKSRHASTDRDSTTAQLNPLLAEIGRKAPEATLPEADVLMSHAVAAEAQASEAGRRTAAAAQAAESISDEVKRRADSVNELGFDALYTTAYFRTYGLPRVNTSLVLKRGESAVLDVAATLARQRTQRSWVGGSRGFSFPIGHTGIRYRVGSFRGHPVEQQFLAHVDNGTLTVTNQRVAYIGSTKSTSTPLQKVMHVECYQDGLAIFREGRENPDFYLVAQPRYALFMINWMLGQGA